MQHCQLSLQWNLPDQLPYFLLHFFSTMRPLRSPLPDLLRPILLPLMRNSLRPFRNKLCAVVLNRSASNGSFKYISMCGLHFSLPFLPDFPNQLHLLRLRLLPLQQLVFEQLFNNSSFEHFLLPRLNSFMQNMLIPLFDLSFRDPMPILLSRIPQPFSLHMYNLFPWDIRSQFHLCQLSGLMQHLLFRYLLQRLQQRLLSLCKHLYQQRKYLYSKWVLYLRKCMLLMPSTLPYLFSHSN